MCISLTYRSWLRIMNNRNRRYLVVLLAFVLFCQGCNESVNSLVNKMTGSTLDFDWTKQTLLGDTVIDGVDFHVPTFSYLCHNQ